MNDQVLDTLIISRTLHDAAHTRFGEFVLFLLGAIVVLALLRIIGWLIK